MKPRSNFCLLPQKKEKKKTEVTLISEEIRLGCSSGISTTVEMQ